VFEKVAERVNDDKVMHLLKLILTANGKRGVPQGGVISPLLANLYLNETDRMLERLRVETSTGKNTHMEYARYADDTVILVDGNEGYRWLLDEVMRRINEALERVEVEINREKTRTVDLSQGESFAFLGFEFRRLKSKNGKWRPDYRPTMKSRRKLTQEIKHISRDNRSKPVSKLISEINPVVRGWVNYFRIGHSTKTFQFVRLWTEKKVRRHMMRAKKCGGFGWKRWSRQWIEEALGLYNDYGIRYHVESNSSRKVS
jgi:RNA-directed DNA polymerase